MKFVILDEVDYMTKNAQQALKYLLHSHPENVRFCLICNYISKIDVSLQNDFVRMRFNQLPKSNIIEFLNNISHSEQLNYTNGQLEAIQYLFNSDMRSMINYMQSNQHVSIKHDIICNDVWDSILEDCAISVISSIDNVKEVSKKYNMDLMNILKNLMNYIVRNKPHIVNDIFLNTCKNITHCQDSNIHYLLNYFFSELHNSLLL